MPEDDDRESPQLVEGEHHEAPGNARALVLSDDLREHLLHELTTYQLELAAQGDALLETQKALDESKARYRQLYADAPIGFFTIGIQGRILNCNQRGADLLRLSIGTAVRRRLTEFMGVESAANFTRQMAHLYHTKEPVTLECELRRADGKSFWAELAMNLFTDTTDGVSVAQLAITDASDRKRLQEDTARLVAIVASSAQAIISHDLDGTITSWNAGAERLFGMTASAAIGHSISLIVPPDRSGEDDEALKSIRRLRTVGMETVRRRQDGTDVPVYVSAAPIVSPTMHVVGVSLIMRDISEQVTSRREVARLLDDLRQADRRKDDFIATLAHELRNPLAPIRNAAAVMRYAPDLSPRLQWCRDVIDRQVAHMATLLDDLLDVSRLTRNKITLRKERVELGTAIAQAVEINRHLIESRGHKLVVDVAPLPIEVEGDLTRLVQVFGNLLNNAAKYTHPGGEISVRITTSDAQALVSVCDNGVGISADHLADIFDLFAQVDPEQEGSEGGLGIGLALVKGLVERHGGSIVARSAGKDRGSEFIVLLPLAPPHPQVGSGEHPVIASKRTEVRALHVLIADDNVDAAESLGLIVQTDHHTVRIAHDGAEALELAQQETPDVMVLDLGMPRMSGYEVARRVRDQEWGKGTVLIACTGWGQPEDRRKAEQSGFDHHLVKPVSASLMLRLLRDIAKKAD